MDIEEIQKRISDLYREREYIAGPQTLVLGAMEELGELAMAILLTQSPDFKPSTRKMTPEWADARDPAREIGDCITYLLALANKLGVKPKFKWLSKEQL